MKTNHGKLLDRVRPCLPGRSIKIWGSAYQEAGLSDLFLCWRGHFVCIELKVPPDKLSAAQLLFLDSMWKAGAYTFEFRMLMDTLYPVFYRGREAMKMEPIEMSELSKKRMHELFEAAEQYLYRPGATDASASSGCG